MALLNWGNALSQAGKAMATVGLEGVKSTLEQDKVRLAADLAAKEGALSDERRATAALGLANLQGEIAATAASTLFGNQQTAAATLVQTNKDAAAELQKSALALQAARDKSPEALATLLNAQSAKALNDFNLVNAKTLTGLQDELKKVTGTDAAAEAQRAEIKSRISAQGTTAATIAADRTGATALLAATGAELSRATTERTKAAAALAAGDPTEPNAIAALDAAIETEKYASSVYKSAVEHGSRNIPGFKPPPIPILGAPASGTPAPGTGPPAPGAGNGEKIPKGKDKNGRPVYMQNGTLVY